MTSTVAGLGRTEVIIGSSGVPSYPGLVGACGERRVGGSNDGHDDER
jgi:hypothetical protein